jgi:hypothetical protein
LGSLSSVLCPLLYSRSSILYPLFSASARLKLSPGDIAIGITIHYRGRIADLERIPDLEDRVLDLALDLGGQAQIWRSSADKDPDRIVRGIILDHAPGQETMSLLISPAGWLIGLTEIEDAELGKLTEPPWVSVKTQFGPIEGHVALIELLSALKAEFIPDLEVTDEGDYWEKRDLELLQKKFGFLTAAMEGMSERLKRYGLSAEAAEDPEILMQRILRIAEKVKRSLGRPSEHAPPEFPDEEQSFAGAANPEEEEAAWDELFKHNQRMQARFQRLLEERLARGEEYETAFEAALKDAGIGKSDDDPEEDEEESFADTFDWPDEDELFGEGQEEDEEFEDEGDETEAQHGEKELAESSADADSDDDDETPFGRDRHPLQRRASDFWMRLHNLFKDDKSAPDAAMHGLMQGAGDLCGGLAQALSESIEGFDDRGLRIVQLKRALRGAAFARGALFNLSSSGALAKKDFETLHETLDEISDEVYRELGRARESNRNE